MKTNEGSWPWEVYPFETGYENGTDQYYLEDIHVEPDMAFGGHNDSIYGTSNDTIIPMMLGLIDAFPSFTTVRNVSDVPVVRDRTWAIAPPRSRLLKFNPWLSPNNVTRHMERLATAMTNVVRSSENKIMLQGDAWSKETYISIRWPWLTFPLLLLLLSLAFLVSTIIKTSKNTGIAVWKTSTMPTLIYSLPKETQGQFQSSSTWNNAPHTRKVRIRLSSNAEWRVSGQKMGVGSPRVPPPAGTRPGGWI
ncbi:hypothetical protein J1614_010169 [Plenodomus biglobosus]|nr:hypothetical protein J1614_010169 [Plenodomus biglobosus]